MNQFFLFGLGNPGKQYENTRHNLGFLVIDHLARTWGASAFHEDKKVFAEITTIEKDGKKIFFVKPTTFMNESGKSVRALLDFYKSTPENIIVLHDDLDIEAGKIRTTTSSRSAGNNGVQDIIDTLGTQDFFRIRLGIGHPTEVEGVCIPHHDYVLGKFTTKEQENFSTLLTATEKALLEFLATR